MIQYNVKDISVMIYKTILFLQKKRGNDAIVYDILQVCMKDYTKTLMKITLTLLRA